ncbi:hypothetical protein CLOM_g18571 [Closterium sp. NIES-68]|nr:hypothetical protein CLOM_g18571 [Closterium sp. NIES-68]
MGPARRTPATRLRHSSKGMLLRQIIKERIRPQEGLIPGTHGEHPKSLRRSQEDRSRTHVKDAREHEGVATVLRLPQLLQQVRVTVRKNCRTTYESAEEEHAL